MTRPHKRHRFALAARFGSCTVALPRAVFRYPIGPNAAWPDELVLPSLARRRSWGSLCPSQIYSRCPGGPAFPPGRAHLPFVPLLRPDWFSSGWFNRPSDKWKIAKGERTGDKDASTSGLHSRLRSGPVTTFGHELDPALGFASCRVGGRDWPRIRSGTTPLGSPAPGDFRERPVAIGSPIRSWVCGVPSRHGIHDRRISPTGRGPDPAGMLPRVAPTLQRFDGADAWPTRPLAGRAGLPV